MAKMKLSEFLARFQPISSEDWEATKLALMNDAYESATVNHLVAALEKNGSFREPVITGIISREKHTAQCAHDCESEDCEHEFPAVTNGTHRVVAHMLAHSEYVDFQTEEDRDAMLQGTHIDDEFLVTTVTLSQDDRGADLGDTIDATFSMLRSFPLNESTWVEASFAGSSNGTIDFYWDNEPRPLDSDAIQAKAKSILDSAGVHYEDINTGLRDSASEKY